jgi:hypothetical protein
MSLDGHVVSGVYTFGVRVAADNVTQAVGAGGPTRTEDIVRWLWFLAPALLVGGPGATSAGVRDVIMKAGNMPAMRVPPETAQMFNGVNVAQIARECRTMQLVAWDDVTVPAGKFHAMHLRDARTSAEFWITPGAQSGIVKLIWKDGSTAVLTAQGNDAKASI